MRRRSFLGVTFLALLAISPAGLSAQDAGSSTSPRDQDSGFELQQNYPNPFNPTTRIPFRLDASLFQEDEPVVVTMRIFNVLQQLVAYPTALDHPAGNGVPVNGLTYPDPGQKEAFWDGRDLDGRQVPSAMYYLQLVVNGRRQMIKMIVSN